MPRVPPRAGPTIAMGQQAKTSSGRSPPIRPNQGEWGSSGDAERRRRPRGTTPARSRPSGATIRRPRARELSPTGQEQREHAGARQETAMSIHWPAASSAFSARIDPRTPHVAISQTDAARSASRRRIPADGSPPRPGRASTGRARSRSAQRDRQAVARIAERAISRPVMRRREQAGPGVLQSAPRRGPPTRCRRPGTT